MKIRIYKYRLSPTHTQLKLLNEIGETSRYLWNRLVSQVRYVQHEINHGRRGIIESEYKDLFANKQLVGMRAKAVMDLATKNQISKEEALKLFVTKSTAKDTVIVVRKNGTKAKKWSANHLAWKFAVEKVNSQRENLLSPNVLNIWTGIQSKWIDFGNSWDKGIFSAPNYKKYGTTSAIQKQIGKTTKWEFGKYVDLSWCGSICLERTKVIVHRPLPITAVIKQIALVKDTLGQWFIAVFIEAEDTVFARNFGVAEGKVVGIDPGMKSALTTSDGERFTPKGLSKDNRMEKKLKRLHRQLDRQTRACNPYCFNEDGTWKRGKRITFRSKGMLETARKIAKIKLHFKDAKADFYHNLSIHLLKNYDTIAIGNAKMHTLARGEGKQKRAFNERSREHAISDFKMKLKDKASLSLTPKTVCDMVETNTTRTCHKCGFVNDKLTLNDRSWACPQCKLHLDRDVNAAINIKISAMKTTVAQTVSEEKSSKVRRITKVNKTRSTEITASQEGELT